MLNQLKFCQQCGSSLVIEQIDDRLRHMCSKCRLPVYLDPKLATVALVSTKFDVLMVKRNIGPGKGLWALPGGYVDRGETVESAVEREVREETGLSVSVGELVGVYS